MQHSFFDWKILTRDGIYAYNSVASFQLRLMQRIRDSIMEDTFPVFVKNFMKRKFSNGVYPKWVVDALNAVNIKLDEDIAS